MQTRRTATILVLIAILLLAFTQTSRATSFSALIVYGDSLTDNGQSLHCHYSARSGETESLSLHTLMAGSPMGPFRRNNWPDYWACRCLTLPLVGP